MGLSEPSCSTTVQNGTYFSGWCRISHRDTVKFNFHSFQQPLSWPQMLGQLIDKAFPTQFSNFQLYSHPWLDGMAMQLGSGFFFKRILYRKINEWEHEQNEIQTLPLVLFWLRGLFSCPAQFLGIWNIRGERRNRNSRCSLELEDDSRHGTRRNYKIGGQALAVVAHTHSCA